MTEHLFFRDSSITGNLFLLGVVFTVGTMCVIALIVFLVLITKFYHQTKINYDMERAQQARRYIDEVTEKTVRVVEEKGKSVNPPWPQKDMVPKAVAMLTDVIREAGLDIAMYNIEGLVYAMRHKLRMRKDL